jgi:DNA polymerase-3 subunit epsilon
LRGTPLAVVDIETTGGHPAHDRITEVAVLEVDGFEVRREWSSLVNPGRSIPGPIQALTGITQDMVEDAPRFERIAAELHARLDGRVFVAHNARFDYGFLRHEFERAGLPFRARTLCTVKLSRRLYRGAAGHSLDALIARHGIRCEARHRALGDAEAAWQFLRIAAGEHGDDILDVAARQVAKEPQLPPHLERAAVDAVPEAPGVYLFYGEAAAPLYIGKSRSMRTRVLSHFSDPKSWVAQVRRIEWRRTAGELGALLLEARLVKELRPLSNRRLRKPEALCGLAFDGKRLEIVEAAGLEADALDCLRGLYRSRRKALEALHALADEEKLCLRALGFEPGPRKGRGPCFRCQIGRCAGVCDARESVAQHFARLAAGLARLEAPHWPYRGPVGIVERDRDRELEEIHLVDRWCYLGAARSEAELAEFSESQHTPRFDYDHYRILTGHLRKRGVRVLQLGDG